jgi:hypothetical protein
MFKHHYKGITWGISACLAVLMLAGCGGGGGAGATTSAPATTAPKTSLTSTGGLTSIEAAELAYERAKENFSDAVLWRMAPVTGRDSISLKLNADWQQSDRAAAWFVWYADARGENWLLISIFGRLINSVDIGTRGSAISMPASWPRESTNISMKQAAAAAVAQGADLDYLTWWNSTATTTPAAQEQAVVGV